MDPKILAVSSGGGHWVQLKRLLPAFDGMDVAFASVVDDYAQEVQGHRYYKLSEFTRFQKKNLPRLVWEIIQVLRVERPTVVITTGQGPALLTMALARLFFGSKTIWVDSIANCERLSTCGKAARLVTDVWLTQWHHLSDGRGPEFWGQVI